MQDQFRSSISLHLKSGNWANCETQSCPTLEGTFEDQGLTIPASSPMAQKTLRQFSAPSNSHIPTGLNNYQGTNGFEIKTGLVNMVQASPFCGKASEDANAHLQDFMEVSSIINPRGTTMDNIHFRLFPFSLLGKAKM